MGIALPQLAPASEDRVSGALVIDGSLKFDGRSGGNHNYGHLRRTSSGASGAGTFTISWWAKRGSMRDDWQYMIAGDNGTLWGVGFPGSSGERDSLTLFNGSHQYSAARFRDNSGWYHIVLSVDADRGPRLWVNGELQSNTNTNASWNLNNTMYIGKWVDSGTAHNYDGYLAQYTCIDGLELGPSYFAYTDPLTGAWRPKKFRAEGTTANDGRVWSSSVTATGTGGVSGISGTNVIANMFDGNTSSYLGTNAANINTNAAILTVSFSAGNEPTYEANVTVEPYAGTTDTVQVAINGGDWQTVSSSSNDWQLHEIARGTGIIQEIKVSRQKANTNAGAAELRSIRVDGVELLDSTTQNLAFGNAGFYLPLDGNTPIGQDLSGNGNDWTPEGFGGSTDITKATGALPILNTLGGTVARAGVFGSEVSANYTTTSNTAAGSGYEFDQTSGFNPSLSFVRGATYTFDYTDSPSHPLAFSTTDPDSSVTSYTDGVNTATSNVTKITIPHNAPDTLYYYCTSHNSMNGRISVTTDTKKADPYASSCIFAAPFISDSKDVSDQINCNSAQKANSSTDTGVTYNSTYTGTNFYNSYGVYAPGGGTSQKVVYSDSEDFNLDGPFTIEFFIKMNSGTDCTIICDDGINGDPQVKYTTTYDRIQLQSSNVNIEIDENTNTALLLSDGKWHHVAFVRSAVNDTNAIYLFIDGVAQTLRARQNTAGSSVNFNQMALFTGAVGRFPGYLQDLRIYKGVAKYTSNFIPASSNPDILPDTPSGVATKSQLTKITDGAVTFDGTGDELNLSGHSDLAFGTGNFTIECFAYFNSFDDTYPTVLSKLVGGTLSWIVRVKNDGKLVWYSKNGSGTNNESSTSPIVLKKWHHIAVVREGTGSNQLKGYVDGKVVLTMTDSNDYNDSNDLCIGTQQSGGGNTINGYISNVRIINGTALYTSNFTPPTRELTNVTNTKLLCCQSNRLPGGYTVCPTSGGLNDGTIWSSLVSAPGGFDSSYQAGLMFNGDTSGTSDAIPSLGNRWTLTHNFGSVSTLRYFTYYPSGNTANGANAFEVNGVTVTPTSKSQGGWTSLPIAGGTLTSFGSKYTGSGDYVFVSAIEVDGTVLLDPIGVFGESKATTFNPFTTNINAVRGQEGTYATLNPLASTVSLSDGNLKQAQTSGTWNVAVSSIPMSTGKWYCEVTLLDGNTFQMGIIKLDDGPNWVANFPLVDFEYGWGMIVDGSTAKLRSDYIAQVNGATDAIYNSTAPVTGDTVGMAYDADTQALTFYVNGESYGDTTPYWSYPPTPGEYVFGNSVVANTDALWNFGQKPFKFPPPDGFQPLTSSTARPDTVVPRPNQYVKATTYTGNGGTKSINVGHKPDLVWIKQRNSSSDHNIFDSVRGVQKRIYSNNTSVEGTISSGLTAFNSDGWTMGSSGNINGTDNTYVGWTWKAGGNNGQFNIDDVGYANASDVNMNVGALNDATYNQDQNWTSLLTSSAGTISNPGNSFDGSTSTTSQLPGTSAGSYIQFGVTLTGVTKLEVYQRTNSDISGTGIRTYNNAPAAQWVELTLASSTVSNIRFEKNTNDPGIYAIRVNGKILVDSTSTPSNVPSTAPTGCSVGTKQGFSIIKYTGPNDTNNHTVPHGLSQAPDFIITKNLDNTYNWDIYHSSLANDAYLIFTSAGTRATGFNGRPTSTVFNTETSYSTNENEDYIAYCWHDVPGLQKFGSYTGNSSSNGPAIDLGFRPALILLKKITNTDSNSGWHWYDNKRNTYNPANNFLLASHSYYENRAANNTADVTTYTVDFLSNGFRLSHSSNNLNTSGETYIYAAWAEAPSFNLYGAQSNAR